MWIAWVTLTYSFYSNETVVFVLYRTTACTSQKDVFAFRLRTKLGMATTYCAIRQGLRTIYEVRVHADSCLIGH